MNRNNDDHRWDRVYEMLGKLSATCDDIKEDLAYHIKRTDLLEDKLQPVEDHVKFVHKAGGILFAVALAVAGYLLA